LDELIPPPPCLPCLVRSPEQPLAPDLQHHVSEDCQRPRVPGDPVVRTVPAKLPTQRCMLHRDRSVAMTTTPLRRRTQSTAKPCLHGTHVSSRMPHVVTCPNSV